GYGCNIEWRMASFPLSGKDEAHQMTTVRGTQMIEPLENRLLMRRGVIQLEGRTVIVSATAGDDMITLSGSTHRTVVTLNGKAEAFVGKDVRRVIVYA